MEFLNQAFWAVVPSIIVGVVMAIWNKKQKDADAQKREYEKIVEKGRNVQISLLVATSGLAYAVGMAVKRGHPNGELESAIENYNKAMDEFREYERELVSRGE